MRRLLLAFVLTYASICLGQTTVTDTIQLAGTSTPAVGTVTVSWPAFTTAGSVPVAAGSVTATITGGAFSVSLQPTVGATPSGTVYTAVFNISNSGQPTSTEIEYWNVPSSGPVGLVAVETATPSINLIAGVLNASTDYNVGTPGTYTKVTTNAKGRVTAGTTLSAGDIPAIPESTVTSLTTDLAAKEVTANKGAANGYAPLDGSSLLPLANVPALPESKTTNLTTDLAAKVVVGGDISGTPSSPIIAKTNSVSFAPSATTDTTNAANIGTGTLAPARVGAINLAASGNGGVTGNLPIGQQSGLAPGQVGVGTSGAPIAQNKSLVDTRDSAGSDFAQRFNTTEVNLTTAGNGDQGVDGRGEHATAKQNIGCNNLDGSQGALTLDGGTTIEADCAQDLGTFQQINGLVEDIAGWSGSAGTSGTTFMASTNFPGTGAIYCSGTIAANTISCSKAAGGQGILWHPGSQAVITGDSTRYLSKKCTVAGAPCFGPLPAKNTATGPIPCVSGCTAGGTRFSWFYSLPSPAAVTGSPFTIASDTVAGSTTYTGTGSNIAACAANACVGMWFAFTGQTAGNAVNNVIAQVTASTNNTLVVATTTQITCGSGCGTPIATAVGAPITVNISPVLAATFGPAVVTLYQPIVTLSDVNLDNNGSASNAFPFVRLTGAHLNGGQIGGKCIGGLGLFDQENSYFRDVTVTSCAIGFEIMGVDNGPFVDLNAGYSSSNTFCKSPGTVQVIPMEVTGSMFKIERVTLNGNSCDAANEPLGLLHLTNNPILPGLTGGPIELAQFHMEGSGTSGTTTDCTLIDTSNPLNAVTGVLHLHDFVLAPPAFPCINGFHIKSNFVGVLDIADVAGNGSTNFIQDDINSNTMTIAHNPNGMGFYEVDGGGGDWTNLDPVDLTKGASVFNGVLHTSGSSGMTQTLAADTAAITATTPATATASPQFTFNSFARNQTYHLSCTGLTTQQIAGAGIGIAIQTTGSLPNVEMHAHVATSLTTVAFGANGSFSSNLAQSVYLGSTGTLTTALPWYVDGSIIVGSGAPTVVIGFYTANAADSVIVKKNATCSIFP